MSERDREQLRLWLRETESDEESVLGIEDPEEIEHDNLEIFPADNKDEEGVHNFIEGVEDQSPLVAAAYKEQAVPVSPVRPDVQHFTHEEFYIGKDRKLVGIQPVDWHVLLIHHGTALYRLFTDLDLKVTLKML